MGQLATVGTRIVLEIVGDDVVEEVVIGVVNVVNSSSSVFSVVVGSTSGTGVVVSAADWID